MRTAAAIAIFCALLVPEARAQLISPGRLSAAHADLEGIRNCTSCHALGNQGVDAARCLGCHEPLKARIDAGRGYHARLTARNCGDCHKEHFGRDFALVRLDEDRFDHAQTGYRLTGAHPGADCRSCHRPAFIADAGVRAAKGRADALARTFLGLSTRCTSCHTPDSPHQGQFDGQNCADCHTTADWEGAEAFDHDRARFRLAGRHRQVDCGGCHPQARTPGGEAFTRFEGIASANCSSCHRDAHGGAFGADCQGCHSPAGWQQVRNFDEGRFDHAATGFALVGRHAALACASCHARPARRDAEIAVAFVPGTEAHTYPRLRVEDCQSCHTDYHDGAFADAPGEAACDGCHGQDGWTPVAFGLARHAEDTRFPLEGAHLVVPCAACHAPEGGPPTFVFDDLACQNCHADDNPHGTQFADASGTTVCAECHTPDAWSFEDFDHAATGFPLEGAHETVGCDGCHRPDPAAPAVFRGLETTCASCHADPHRGQFADRTCETCHTVQGFARAAGAFDHGQTRFPLTGAHRGLDCASCHRPETAPDGDAFIRFHPLGTACKDCHSDG